MGLLYTYTLHRVYSIYLYSIEFTIYTYTLYIYNEDYRYVYLAGHKIRFSASNAYKKKSEACFLNQEADKHNSQTRFILYLFYAVLCCSVKSRKKPNRAKKPIPFREVFGGRPVRIHPKDIPIVFPFIPKQRQPSALQNLIQAKRIILYRTCCYHPQYIYSLFLCFKIH